MIGDAARLAATVRREDGEVIGAAGKDGRVWGTYLHGIFDADEFRRWFIDRLRVRFLGPMTKVLGEREYKFTHNPDTKAGWQKPGCFYALSGGARGIQPLARVSLGDSALDVAGAQMDVRGKAKFVFVPEYLVSPYLLTDVQSIRDPSRPELDEVGRGILKTALDMLAPEMTRTR